MSAVDTLQRISELLPDEQRQRFLLMCASFKNVPEDDEYLHILEAIGFMTLLWKQVPREISKILDGVTPIKTNHQDLEKMIRQVVSESVPSYEDLKVISRRLERSRTGAKTNINTEYRGQASSKQTSVSPARSQLAFC